MIRVLTIVYSVLIQLQRSGSSKHYAKLYTRQKHRNLHRSCPPLTNSLWDTQLNDDTIQEEITKNPYAFYHIGQRSNELLQRMQHRESTYYQNLADNIAMFKCDVTTESQRCVGNNSGSALIDNNGSCKVAAADTACNLGMCEREGNCYWDSIYSSAVNRTTRYPPNKYSEAKDALFSVNSTSYLRSLLTIGAIGIIISLVLLLLWIIYFVGRCCCCCLWTSFSLCYVCSPIPKQDGYLIFWHWILPALLCVVFSVTIFLATFYSYMGACAIIISFSKSVAYVSRLLEGLITLFDRYHNGLLVIKDSTESVAVDAISIYNSSYGINTTMSKIMSFDSLYPKAISIVLSTNLGALVQTIQQMIIGAKQIFYDGESTTQLAISSTIEELDAFKRLLSAFLQVIQKVEAIETRLRLYIKLGLMTVPLVAIVLCSAGVLGLIFSSCKKRCQGCPSFLGFSAALTALWGSVALITGSVFLIGNILWLDSCRVSDIITADFRPFLGERNAILANQVMNDTDLSVTLNFVQIFDFLTKWDDNLAYLQGNNITMTFAIALQQMKAYQSTVIDTITENVTSVFDVETSYGSNNCFNDHYSAVNIFEPWMANQGKDHTAWILSSTGLQGDYKRLGNESGLEYINRIYNVAGYCNSSLSCCLNQNCNLYSGYSCNNGTNCNFNCSEKYSNIIRTYNLVLDAYDFQQNMTSDWGIVCPSHSLCPTENFRNLINSNKTVADLVSSSEGLVSMTMERLINTTESPLGGMMDNIHALTCNSNMSFVGLYYSLAKDEFCGAMVHGFAQINVSLWIISIALEVLAVLMCILSIRLRGRSRKHKLFDTNYDDLVTVVTSYKPEP